MLYFEKRANSKHHNVDDGSSNYLINDCLHNRKNKLIWDMDIWEKPIPIMIHNSIDRTPYLYMNWFVCNTIPSYEHISKSWTILFLQITILYIYVRFASPTCVIRSPTPNRMAEVTTFVGRGKFYMWKRFTTNTLIRSLYQVKTLTILLI